MVSTNNSKKIQQQNLTMDNLIDEYTVDEWEQIHKEFKRIKGISKKCSEK